jgi:hypothetical protein
MTMNVRLNVRRTWLAPALTVLALAAAGCGDPENGGDIVPSTGSDGQTTPATVPNGPGTPEETTSTGATTSGTTSTSSTATGTAPAPGDDGTP